MIVLLQFGKELNEKSKENMGLMQVRDGLVSQNRLSISYSITITLGVPHIYCFLIFTEMAINLAYTKQLQVAKEWDSIDGYTDWGFNNMVFCLIHI